MRSMTTLAQSPESYAGPHNKSGWPTGKYPHRVGAVHRIYAQDLSRCIERHVGEHCEIQTAELRETDYVEVFVVGKIGINEFSALRMFVEGYKSGVS